MNKTFRRSAGVGAGMLAALIASTATAETRSSETDELRNTVVNLLDSLVQKGILTKDQAEQLVASAQAKAEADARARDAVEPDAVRVTAVPQIVQDKIAEQVSEQITGKVSDKVVARAKREGWGVPGALPAWVGNLNFYGDVRARGEVDSFADTNLDYLDFNTINSKGGVTKAGDAKFLNTHTGRTRFVGRARFGVTAQLGNSLSADLRLVTGTNTNPVSTNQTEGNYGARYVANFDRASIQWRPISATRDWGLDVRAGRFDNPFATNSELIFDQDLNFEGVSSGLNWNYAQRVDRADARRLFVTFGAFPIQEVELSNSDKWLFGAQIGTELRFGYSRLRFAAAYYDFTHIAGQRNTQLDGTQFDWTAPKYLSKGNTLFDIRYDADPSTNLLALAGDYRLITGLLQFDARAWGNTHLVLNAEYVKNIGWKASDVVARAGGLSGVILTGEGYELGSIDALREQTSGYEGGVTLGAARIGAFGDWRVGLAYRYLERDAVLDAFTDSDFHLGGTDARGYIFSLEMGLARSALVRLRYLSANEINGGPLGIDVAQLDLLGQF